MSTAAVRDKSSSTEKNDPFLDKRRLLSYWKSLDSPKTPDKDKPSNVSDELLDELKQCLEQMDSSVSHVVYTEDETSRLQNEQLSLLHRLGGYVQYFIKPDKNELNLEENFKIKKEDSNHVSALKAEIALLLEENENLVRKIQTHGKEHESFSKEQQGDIEKLTREIQSSTIARKRLERELLQVKKLNDEKDAAINSLRLELRSSQESYDCELKRLRGLNEQVSKDNSELVEKGREATESLKVALQQLTEEKKALQEHKKSLPGKETRELEASLERAKKERETFRQRCEKSEMMQRNLQEEVTSLKNQVKLQYDKVKPTLQKKENDSIAGIEMSHDVGKNDSGEDTTTTLKSAQSRISQLKNYVHVLEDRLKEKEENILSLRKDNARCNDLAMEKSLELSRARRILERKIEKLVKENSEWKRKFLIPNSIDKNVEDQRVDISNIENNNKQQQQQQQQQPGTKAESRKAVRAKGFRRRSNPERSAVQSTLNRLNDIHSSVSDLPRGQHLLPNNTKHDEMRNVSGNHGKDSALAPAEVQALDVAPRRRIGGKFIRASAKRHSADLGKLMSRPESAVGRKMESDQLVHGDEPVTIFVNRYRKKSEEEEHWV